MDEAFITGQKTDNFKDMSVFVEAFIEMMKAGYMEEKTYNRISDWIVGFEVEPLRFFRDYYEIKPERKLTFDQEFCSNSSFRKNITLGMRNVIANFCINNDIMSRKDVKKMGGWDNLEVYEKIQKSLTN